MNIIVLRVFFKNQLVKIDLYISTWLYSTVESFKYLVWEGTSLHHPEVTKYPSTHDRLLKSYKCTPNTALSSFCLGSAL